MREYIAELWKRREFMRAWPSPSSTARTRTRLLGELWAVLDPLFQAAIYLFLDHDHPRRRRAARRPPDARRSSSRGVFLFNCSQRRVRARAAGRSSSSKGLVLNSTFPLAMLPLAAMYKGLLEFLPALGVYAVIHVAAQQPIGPGIVPPAPVVRAPDWS